MLSNNASKICLVSKTIQRYHKPVVTQLSRIMSTINSSKSTPKSMSVPERSVASLPESVQPFARLMRLDKPTGAQLLMWPSFWSIALATPASHLPSLTTLGLFGLGSLVMRGAGCVVNDLWDKDFDKKVERTKSRPLASDQLTTTDAVMLLGGLCGCGLLILVQFDLNSIALGASSLLLVTTYPLFKRFTYWPQFVLGLTFNWGALLGWSVVANGVMDWSAVLPLYVSGICWTLIYDTIYAHQDKRDDLIIGLKSTAIKFGKDTTKWLSAFSAIMCSSLVLTGINTSQCWPYYTAVAITGLNLIHQTSTLNINSQEDCWRKFKQNTQIGWILFVGIVLSTYLKTQKPENSSDKTIESKDKFEVIGGNQTLIL